MRRTFIFLFCLILSGCAHLSNGYEDLKAKPKGQLRVASYNLNWGEKEWHNGKPLATIKAIATIDSDILLLQEVTEKWQEMLDKHLSKQYKYREYRFDVNAGGLGIFSRYPINNLQLIPKNHGRHDALLCSIKTPLGALQVMNLHLNPPLTRSDSLGLFGHAVITTSSLRRYEVEAFYRAIKPGRATILGGDFNESDYGAAGQYLYQKGFEDALLVHKDNAATWHWPIFFYRYTRRIDHIYFNKPLVANHVFVLHEGSSDHFPVMVDFSRS